MPSNSDRKQKITLYPWQSECLSLWKENNRHGIVHVITGAGKTFFAIAAAQELIDSCGGNAVVCVVVPTVALAAQWKKQISSISESGERVGLYCGSVKSGSDCRWMIYVVNSARYSISRHILKSMEAGKHVLLICDECHHYTSAENRKIFDFIGSRGFNMSLYSSLGLSATPRCAGLDDVLVPALGKIIFTYSFSRGTEENTVSRFALFQISLRFTPDEQLQYNSFNYDIQAALRKTLKEHPELAKLDRVSFFHALQKVAKADGEDSPAHALLTLYYRRRLLSILARRRMDCTVGIIRELPEDTRMFIFCERIDQAEAMWRVLESEFPGQALCYHSKFSKEARNGVLFRFRNHQGRILVCCKALDEGLDVPDASVAVILSGTGQERQRIQRLGRILRRNSGKRFACLYYCHVTDSAEDWQYLPKLDRDFPQLDLYFHAVAGSASGSFEHPEYLDLSNELLAKYKSAGCGADVLSELRTCLLRGQLLPDWLEPPEVLHAKAESAESPREKNYFYAMKRLSCLRLTSAGYK